MLNPTCANRSDLERERKTERLNSIATELEIHRQGLNTQLAPTSRVIYNADPASTGPANLRVVLVRDNLSQSNRSANCDWRRLLCRVAVFLL